MFLFDDFQLPIITFWYLIRCKCYANTRLLSPMSFPLFYFGHNDYLCTNEHKTILFVFEYLYLSHAIIVNKISYFWCILGLTFIHGLTPTQTKSIHLQSAWKFNQNNLFQFIDSPIIWRLKWKTKEKISFLMFAHIKINIIIRILNQLMSL